MSEIMNPLQSMLAQASKLPETGAVKERAQRLDTQPIGTNVMVLDISGSMNEKVGRSKKITTMRKVVDALDANAFELLLFSSSTDWWDRTSQFTASGGTAMHLAIAIAATKHPDTILIISDGMPDDESAAIAQAQKLTNTTIINTIYIGPDSNLEAIAFMKRLAQMGRGSYAYQEPKGIKFLAKQIRLALPGA